MKACFPAHNSPDNGERVHSLLCDREALAKPSGMAEFTTKQEVGFNVDNQHAVMNGIRKGNPCGAAMYTSLTCLTLFTAEGSGSKQVANK
ncbi:hypothetical protein DOR53_23945 [Salmonella enterica subsp. enterica serovar Bareilly]|nr:hypothetical protein [Salmonella enterica subsp. enterica serovar Bareilly]